MEYEPSRSHTSSQNRPALKTVELPLVTVLVSIFAFEFLNGLSYLEIPGVKTKFSAFAAPATSAPNTIV